jgi:hypothetical protein
MKTIKKIFHWLIFLFIAPIITYVTLAISTLLPFFALAKIEELNIFWFILLSSLIIAIYYALNSLLTIISFYAINKMKPDYWISNILIVSVALLFYFTLFKSLGKIIDSRIIFSSFKNTFIVLLLAPSYWGLLFKSLIFPFIYEKEEDSGLLLL